MTREETHKKLLELRDRATRQPISYKPLFNEAVDIAADLLHELCDRDAGVWRRDCCDITTSALTKLAAECHRTKWQFDFNDENRMPVSQARDMVRRAFDELHRIGDMALELRKTRRGEII